MSPNLPSWVITRWSLRKTTFRKLLVAMVFSPLTEFTCSNHFECLLSTQNSNSYVTQEALLNIHSFLSVALLTTFMSAGGECVKWWSFAMLDVLCPHHCLLHSSSQLFFQCAELFYPASLSYNAWTTSDMCNLFFSATWPVFSLLVCSLINSRSSLLQCVASIVE